MNGLDAREARALAMADDLAGRLAREGRHEDARVVFRLRSALARMAAPVDVREAAVIARSVEQAVLEGAPEERRSLAAAVAALEDAHAVPVPLVGLVR